MGRSQADKAISHERIVKLAAARFRERGVDGISVADLMKEVGMTHGGFYRHFPSRDDLVAEAIDLALRDGSQLIERAVHKKPDSALEFIIQAYLSLAHRDATAKGCAVVALATDVARSTPAVRETYAAQVRQYLAILTQLQPKGSSAQLARQNAVVTLCALVGAVSMARAVDDEVLSQEILSLTHDALMPKAELKIKAKPKSEPKTQSKSSQN